MAVDAAVPELPKESLMGNHVKGLRKVQHRNIDLATTLISTHKVMYSGDEL